MKEWIGVAIVMAAVVAAIANFVRGWRDAGKIIAEYERSEHGN